MSPDVERLTLRVLELEAENRALKEDVAYWQRNARKWMTWHDELKAGKTSVAAVDERFTFGT